MRRQWYHAHGRGSELPPNWIGPRTRSASDIRLWLLQQLSGPHQIRYRYDAYITENQSAMVNSPGSTGSDYDKRIIEYSSDSQCSDGEQLRTTEWLSHLRNLQRIETQSEMDNHIFDIIKRYAGI